MSSESIKQELEEEAKPYEGEFIDFENHLLAPDKEKQQKWLEDFAVQIRNTLFSEERSLTMTNTPHTHEAMFIEEVIDQYIHKAWEYGYLGDVGGTKFTENGIRFLGLKLEYYPEGMPHVHFPDYGVIRAIADKDKELFPDPESIRVEMAGAIIRFTTWEAALVVYMDCAFKGKTLHISVQDEYLRFIDTSKFSSAEVVERTYGAGNSICAAIFPRIPLVTDYHRRYDKVVTCDDCRVSYRTVTDRDEPTYSETVTIFRGQVIDIDWRGRLPQPQPIATPAASTTGTPLSSETLQSKRERSDERKATTGIHPSQLDSLGWFVGAHGELYEARIIAVGERKGENTASAHYPSAVIRDQQGIQALAEHSFQTWFRSLKAMDYEKKNWELSSTEGKRLYVAAYIAAYTNEVAKRDKEADVTPTIQATSTTGTPSNKATLQGATITLKRVEHNANECVYHLKIDDPNFIDGGYEQEWVVPLDEDSTMPDTSTAASSSYGAFASSSSDLIPLPDTSKYPQKPRKPNGGYFRQPQ